MGYKKLSDEQEKQLVQEYISGIPVKDLMIKYNFATKKSITDKVKKHYGENYKNLINSAKINRKGYYYTFEKINNQFDAYYLGLLLTDGYITTRGTDVGLDLVDKDCISFLSNGIGKKYNVIKKYRSNEQNRYRLIVSGKELVNNLQRYGVVKNKTFTLEGPQLLPEEEKFIPYIIRGIIDGDGTVSPTSYGAPQFFIYTASEKFADWLVYILENKMYMIDIHKNFQINEYNELWKIGSANHNNILKLITLSYDKPFGMERKYKEIRKTFNDYNNSALFTD
jgi:hypothetical protein